MPSKISSAPTSMKSAMRIAKRLGSVLFLPPDLDISVPWAWFSAGATGHGTRSCTAAPCCRGRRCSLRCAIVSDWLVFGGPNASRNGFGMIWGKAFFGMTRKWGGWDVYAGVAMSPTTALSSTKVELAPALDQAATALQRTWNVLTEPYCRHSDLSPSP